MKLFKTVLAASAVAALMTSCTSLTDATDDQLNEVGIEKKSIELFNTWGKGPSGLDAVKGEGVKVSKGADNNGYVTYASADSARVDFKALNNYDRASYLQKKLVSLNGTTYAQVDSADFVAVTKNYKTFKTKLKGIADTASATSLVYSSTSPYFVASLGKDGARGYCLAKVTAIDTAYTDSSATNTGVAKVDYYYVSAASAAE